MRRILIFAVAMVLTAAVQAQKAKVLTAEDFAQGAPKCSKGTASFTVKVGVEQPVYQIRLIEDPVSAETATLHHVGRIEVSQGGALRQTINVNSIWDDSLCNYFEMSDVNFDGYLDIAVLRDAGGKWMRRDYYIFDPASGHFVTNALTEDLAQVQSSSIVLDHETEQIEAPFFKGRCAGEDIYKINHGRLEKIQEQEITPRGDECGITVKQNQNGSWQVVHTNRALDIGL